MTIEEAIEYLNTLYMALAVFPNQQISLGNIDEMKESVSMAIKALEQEPTEPLYRLITDSDNLMLLEDYKTGVRTVIEKRIVPCDDVVSRQAVLEIAKQHTLTNDYLAIQELPPVRPQEPKTGHWILKRTFPTKLYDEYLNEYKCSECYRGIRCTESQLVNYPFCHCGARMVEPQERSDKE